MLRLISGIEIVFFSFGWREIASTQMCCAYIGGGKLESMTDAVDSLGEGQTKY